MNQLASTKPESAIQINVDPTNPGQFFACCGLLELADRLWQGAEGWFERTSFCIASVRPTSDSRTLPALLDVVCITPLEQLDADDDFSSAIRLADPFKLTLDWWQDVRAGGNRLKVWAGSMRPLRIARAMQAALARPEIQFATLLDHGMIVFDPAEPDKKVEPYYFDGRRGLNAQSLDIGFAPDALQMNTAAYPAVEFLSLVGLQRCRPLPTETPRVFDYYTWDVPCTPDILPAAICGLLRSPDTNGYRFENAFRTDQKKHKAFLPAVPIGGSR